jgi:hypothetical protein
VLSSKTYAYTHAYTHVDDGACSGWPSRQDEMKQQEGKSVRQLNWKGREARGEEGYDSPSLREGRSVLLEKVRAVLDLLPDLNRSRDLSRVELTVVVCIGVLHDALALLV